MSGYAHFSRYYDALTRNVGYRQRAEYFHSIIQQYKKGAGLLLDLACGTGSLSIELAALGYEVIGADASAEMLSVAMQKQAETEYNILFLRQPMQKLDLYGTVEVCVCALDSLNHLLDEEALRQTFARVGLFVEPGGLFLFDVNTEYKHRRILADNTFVYDLPEVYCAWQNRYTPKHHRVDISLDLFVREEEEEGYSRYTERFSERVFPHGFLVQTLDAAGFDLIALYGDDTFLSPTEDAQRLVYAAKKRED